MATDGFSAEIAEELKWYVYRLIDPRNGETFYVGKGKGNRVFEHAKGMIGDPDSHTADPKKQRIHQIQAAGLDVGHVIHRHGISASATAYEVEAALIDAYPGLLNKAAGHHSKDKGSRHVSEIIAEYEAEEFTVEEPLILISIGIYGRDVGIYEAVRGFWKINVKRAEEHKLVLAHIRGVVKGAFRPRKWFAGEEEYHLGRYGFYGEPAEPHGRDTYVNKRVPEKHRKKGAANPVRYLYPE